MALNPQITAKLKEYEAEATAKLAELPKRIELEAQLAKEEGRQPYPIDPLIEFDPAVLGPFLEAVGTGKVPDSLAETYGVIRRVCQRQKQKANMRCDQLLSILKLSAAPNA